MRPAKILQWVFIGGTGIWAAALAGGTENWFTSMWTWIVTGMLVLTALALGVFIILWVLKMLGVIANLPWTLDRKLNERP
ncbi:MAG TPA: hypothetical protein VD978_33730 [Azospirillum sp.]|nr:hypothetical protein [Azospirillum sp.]